MDLEQQPVAGGAKALVDLLTSLNDLMVEQERMKADMKVIDDRVKALKSAAADSIRSSGLESVRAAGRTWYIQPEPRLSVTAANRKKVLEAAIEMGWHDEVLDVATSTLKSLLRDRLKELPAGSRTVDEESGWPSLVAGTPFAGLVSEYTETALRARRVS